MEHELQESRKLLKLVEQRVDRRCGHDSVSLYDHFIMIFQGTLLIQYKIYIPKLICNYYDLEKSSFPGKNYNIIMLWQRSELRLSQF